MPDTTCHMSISLDGFVAGRIRAGRTPWASGDVTFARHPAVGDLAARAQARLAGLPGLDLIPAPWLHLTMQGIDFTDEVPDADIAAIIEGARERLAGRPAGQDNDRASTHSFRRCRVRCRPARRPHRCPCRAPRGHRRGPDTAAGPRSGRVDSARQRRLRQHHRSGRRLRRGPRRRRRHRRSDCRCRATDRAQPRRAPVHVDDHRRHPNRPVAPPAKRTALYAPDCRAPEAARRPAVQRGILNLQHDPLRAGG